MTPPFRPLPVQTVAESLTQFANLQLANPKLLSSLRVALATAIASGQDAAELMQQLSAPGAWLAPLIPTGQPALVPTPVQPTATGLPVTPVSPIHPFPPIPTPLPPVRPGAPTPPQPPDWAITAAQAGVQAHAALRLAVFDADPAIAIRSQAPAWTIGQKPSAVYGPLDVVQTATQLIQQKWIVSYLIPVQVVAFVRGTTTLFVAPVGLGGIADTASIAAGSVWVNVDPFVGGAPANSFAGMSVQSGSINSDQPLTFGSNTVTVPNGANLTVTIVPTVTPAAHSSSQVSPPANFTFSFPAATSSTGSFPDFSASVCGEAFVCKNANQASVYNDVTKTLAFPCTTSQTAFEPASSPGPMLTITGKAPLLAAGWAFNVAQNAPSTLGNAANSGFFYLGFAGGISASWTALNQPEPQAGGILLASNSGLVIWTGAGLAPKTSRFFKVQLWNIDSAPSSFTLNRIAGGGLVYELLNASEVVELGGPINASLDRPVLADGSRMPMKFPQGLLFLINSGTHQRLIATGANPPTGIAVNPIDWPVALDNALLEVSAPFGFLLTGTNTTVSEGLLSATSGAGLFGFQYNLEFPFLPDPYAGNTAPFQRENPPPGGLLAEVAWKAPAEVALRLLDTGHPHPPLPPTTEASSDLTPPVASSNLVSPLPHALELEERLIKLPFAPDAVPAHEVAAPPHNTRTTGTERPVRSHDTADPIGLPCPAPTPGFRMLDVSTRASQLGVQVSNYTIQNSQSILTIDGLSARTAAILAPIITLPALSWEPMYNQSPPVAGSPTDLLGYPPNDGPICGVAVASVTLVPVSPIQSLSTILSETQKDGAVYGATLTLPFGMVASIAQSVGTNGAPPPALTQPSFTIAGTNGTVDLTGAYQLTLRPPPGTDPNAPLFNGKTFLRTPDDNPPLGMSYGEEVLGFDVAKIFDSRFNKPGTGVPLKRYDLTGYGASLFSDWTQLNPTHPTDIIQVDLNATVGRTSHEVVQAQSIIYPWGIRVVRTITIDRLNSGSVERTDSGWIAASDGTFAITTSLNDYTTADVHAGVIQKLLKVKNVTEFGLPLNTPGTSDDDATKHISVTMQPVTFDCEVAINPQHTILQGGAKATGLDSNLYMAVPATGIVGYIGLTALYHLSLTDLMGFLNSLPQKPGGPIHSTLNLGGSSNLFRTASLTADPAQDGVVGKNALVITARGMPTLPSDGAWSVALKGTSDAAPRALDATTPVPLIQNGASQTPGTDAHFADPSDIFRLDAAPPAPPSFLYGFLQNTGSQKSFLAHPYVSKGLSQLNLRQVPSLADPGILLGAVSSFPVLGSALPLTGLQNLASKLGTQSLSIDRWFDTDKNKVTHLIQTSVANVDLVYRWRNNAGDPQPNPPTPPGQPAAQPDAFIHVTLGQPSGPSWSIDIYQVALKLVIPPVSSDPALWLEGSFHADANSLPSFPDLQVVYDGPLAPLTQFFNTLKKLGSFVGGGSTPHALEPHDAGSGDDSGLSVHFADGKLTIQDTFPLPQIPLGPGYIEDVSLNLGASIDIVKLDVGFLVGIGSPQAPVHWIVDPLSGTGCLQAGVQDGGLAVLIQLGLGLGLAIDLGIASGGASITIAFQVQITNKFYELMLILTGQAQVTVLGGVASASISLSCGLGLQFMSLTEVTAIGTASVGIHISICWVVSIDFSGSWSFSHQFELPSI